MKNQVKTIRLVYPQWQGGIVDKWVTEVKDSEQASRGYYLGAQLLNFLAPDSGQATFTVPVATDIVERKVTDGVMDKEAIIAQTRAAMDNAINAHESHLCLMNTSTPLLYFSTMAENAALNAFLKRIVKVGFSFPFSS